MQFAVRADVTTKIAWTKSMLKTGLDSWSSVLFGGSKSKDEDSELKSSVLIKRPAGEKNSP